MKCALLVALTLASVSASAQANTYTADDVAPSDFFDQPTAAVHQLNELAQGNTLDMGCMFAVDSIMHRLERVTKDTMSVAILVRLNSKMVAQEDEKETLYPIASLANSIAKPMVDDLRFMGPNLNQTCSNPSVQPAIVEVRKAYKQMAGYLARVEGKLPGGPDAPKQ